MDTMSTAASAAAEPSPPTAGDGGAGASGGAPRRYIYTQADMEKFRHSPARRELLSFATALGRSCADDGVGYRYDPSDPLAGLSPAAASLHGSLRHVAERWLADLPPDKDARARFGNPAFRAWHARLVERSEAIVRSALDCHRFYAAERRGGTRREARRQEEKAGTDGDTEMTDAGADSGREEGDNGSGGGGRYGFDAEVLRSCSEAGYAAASGAPNPPLSAAALSAADAAREVEVVEELRAYLHLAFGHPTRLDYGTGHESSFLIFLYGLCKLGCLGGGSDKPPSPADLAPVALSVFSQYLAVTRGLQRDYMLEPAGSHGVWGLDDYHCLPFYFGACQLQRSEGDHRDITPRSIHDDALLKARGDDLMYLGCIRYVKELKPGVPFFESSPMLDDISHLPSWGRVSRGLLRLYEGEVLDKMPVVQHFEFGTLFKANWTPSQLPREAPMHTFINGPGGDECIAPWAQNPGGGGGAAQPPTRAPWSPNSNPGAMGGGDGVSSGLPPPTRAPWAR